MFCFSLTAFAWKIFPLDFTIKKSYDILTISSSPLLSWNILHDHISFLPSLFKTFKSFIVTAQPKQTCRFIWFRVSDSGLYSHLFSSFIYFLVCIFESKTVWTHVQCRRMWLCSDVRSWSTPAPKCDRLVNVQHVFCAQGSVSKYCTCMWLWISTGHDRDLAKPNSGLVLLYLGALVCLIQGMK